MRRFAKYLLSSLLVGILAAYAIWTQHRPQALYLTDLRSQPAISLGQPGDRGNLLGIQPLLYPSDYQSPAQLRLKLAAYLDQARSQGLLNAKTLVVLPEHIGTWLFVSGEKDQLYHAATLPQAMGWLAASNPLRLLRALLSATGEDRLSDALLRMQAAQMAADYQKLFGGLAKAYGVTLVAGSIVLPTPRVEDGRLLPGEGPLYNISLVFASDGRPLGQPQPKMAASLNEQGFIAAAPAGALQALETPAGRLAVLICTDSPAAMPATKQVDLLAIPAFVSGNQSSDCLEKSSAAASISVFLHGQLWDRVGSGASRVNHHGRHLQAPPGRAARLINLWL